MILFWRKNKEIDKFANILADELYSQLPLQKLDKWEKTANKKFNTRFEKELLAMVIKLQEYKDIHKLGVYGKARFHLTFMERLRSHGYPESLTKEINDYLLVKVP